MLMSNLVTSIDGTVHFFIFARYHWFNIWCIRAARGSESCCANNRISTWLLKSVFKTLKTNSIPSFRTNSRVKIRLAQARDFLTNKHRVEFSDGFYFFPERLLTDLNSFLPIFNHENPYRLELQKGWRYWKLFQCSISILKWVKVMCLILNNKCLWWYFFRLKLFLYSIHDYTVKVYKVLRISRLEPWRSHWVAATPSILHNLNCFKFFAFNLFK